MDKGVPPQRIRCLGCDEPELYEHENTIGPREISTVVPAIRCHLTPDTMRKIVNFIDANLDSTIYVKQLAALSNRSRYHFAHAFRQSFGETPHAYIIRKRIERAKGMMLTGVTPLSQIAVECGLADQSHLTRLFRRLVGEPPGAWRRTRATLL